MAIDFSPLQGQRAAIGGSQQASGWAGLQQGLHQIVDSIPTSEELYDVADLELFTKKSEAWFKELALPFMGSFKAVDYEGSNEYNWVNTVPGTEGAGFNLKTGDEAWNSFTTHLKESGQYSKWDKKGLIDPLAFQKNYNALMAEYVPQLMQQILMLNYDPNLSEDDKRAIIEQAGMTDFLRQYAHLDETGQIAALVAPQLTWGRSPFAKGWESIPFWAKAAGGIGAFWGAKKLWGGRTPASLSGAATATDVIPKSRQIPAEAGASRTVSGMTGPVKPPRPGAPFGPQGTRPLPRAAYNPATGKPYTPEEIIEIKPFNQTRPPKQGKKQKKTIIKEQKAWIMNSSKWKFAKDFCEKHGIKFRIITEKELLI